MSKYAVGLDFGTLSGRAVLVDVETGEEIGSSVMEYPHAVMEEELPSGIKLPMDYSLQHPQDYIDVLSFIVPDVLKKTGLSPDDVVGLGLDFTSCTVLPVDEEGNALALTEEFEDDPMAYVMMWKHHGAQDYATRLTDVASGREEEFLKHYGGKLSSESLTPRLWQIFEEDPELYNAMGNYIEAGDWIVWQLTGNKTRSSSAAGYKALYDVQNQTYPSKDFYRALNKDFENVVEEKLSGPIISLGTKAGEINEKGARLTGLNPGTAVAAASIDAHAGVPGAMKTVAPDQMLMIMGTSNVHLLISEENKNVPGVFGIVKDGILPGFYGYEAGQSGFGDIYAWFVDSFVSKELDQEAREKGVNYHQLLTEKAETLKPGEHGLIALDWWNGNRSILIDNDLSGVILGLTLTTKPEDIYRALIESTAFGTREIVDNFENNGVPVKVLYATGGIAMKNPMLMQIFSDVTKKPIKLAGSTYGPAIGSAVMGAVAAGAEAGGYDNVFDAAKAMANEKDIEYHPIQENSEVYDRLFEEYHRIHDFLGRGGDNILKNIKNIKTEIISGITEEE